MSATGLSRTELEAVIETLIAMLDDEDGDCDLEPSDHGIADRDGLAEQFVGHGLFRFGAAI